jgi:hypothetical protein
MNHRQRRCACYSPLNAVVGELEHVARAAKRETVVLLSLSGAVFRLISP